MQSSLFHSSRPPPVYIADSVEEKSTNDDEAGAAGASDGGISYSNTEPELFDSSRSIRLADFDISERRGFLRDEAPVKKLTQPYYHLWEKYVDLLPKLLASMSVKRHLDRLPTLELDFLENQNQFRRAMLILSMLGHAYVFEPCYVTGGQPRDYIPECIAIPWKQIADHLEVPPVLAYHSIALHNWEVIDSTGPCDLTNLAILNQFLGGVDEAWFYLVTIEIEAKGAKALLAITRAIQAVADKDATALLQQLLQLRAVINDELLVSLKKMYERCDPAVFYKRVRIFLAGWKGNPSLPSGLWYQGCETETGEPLRLQFHGGSAGQSTLIAAIDAALSTNHNDRFLSDMMQYMPVEHRSFLRALRQTPNNIRQFVIAHNSEALTIAYNDCVKAVGEFRSGHIQMVALYIICQTKDKNKERGTGGSDLMPFLKRIRESTLQTCLPLPGDEPRPTIVMSMTAEEMAAVDAGARSGCLAGFGNGGGGACMAAFGSEDESGSDGLTSPAPITAPHPVPAGVTSSSRCPVARLHRSDLSVISVRSLSSLSASIVETPASPLLTSLSAPFDSSSSSAVPPSPTLSDLPAQSPTPLNPGRCADLVNLDDYGNGSSGVSGEVSGGSAGEDDANLERDTYGGGAMGNGCMYDPAHLPWRMEVVRGWEGF